MRARDVIGKRIVKIEHTRWYDSEMDRLRTDCVAIELEDGTRIVAHAYETIDCPQATMMTTDDCAKKKRSTQKRG